MLRSELGTSQQISIQTLKEWAGPATNFDPSRAESQLHEDSIMAAWSHLFEYVPVKIILGCVVCRFAQGPP